MNESTVARNVETMTPTPRTPAEALAESCQSWLPGLTAQGDTLAVPLIGPAGTLSVSMTLIQPSPWILVTSDPIVMAAYRALGKDAEGIALNQDFSIDEEGDELQSGFAMHGTQIPALFAEFRDGLIALLYAADMLTPEPVPPQPEPSTEVDLQLSQIAETVAHEFYKAQHYLTGGAGMGQSWEKASQAMRETMRAKAERAVRTVDPIRESHARRQARLWLKDALRRPFEDVWRELAFERPGMEYLLRSALNRIEDRLMALDPAEQMAKVYERVLQFGPESLHITPVGQKGGA